MRRGLVMIEQAHAPPRPDDRHPGGKVWVVSPTGED
jgi:hypothetical protein